MQHKYVREQNFFDIIEIIVQIRVNDFMKNFFSQYNILLFIIKCKI